MHPPGLILTSNLLTNAELKFRSQEPQPEGQLTIFLAM